MSGMEARVPNVVAALVRAEVLAALLAGVAHLIRENPGERRLEDVLERLGHRLEGLADDLAAIRRELAG